MTDIIDTIGADLKAFGNWAKTEVQDAWTTIWNTTKVVFTGIEPTLVSGVLTELTSFLQTAEDDIKNGEIGDIEDAFMNYLETEKTALFADADTLGSDLLQALIGMAKATLAKV